MDGTETHVFKSVGSLGIKMDIHRSTTANEGARPAVMFIHGGGLIAGGRDNLLPSHIAAFNGVGIDLVSIDYRLAPETPLPEIIADVEDAWSWIRSNGESVGIDPDRIAVMGHSAGGYLALVGGFRFDPRPKAIVSIAGYGDLLHEAFVTPSRHYLEARESAPAEDVQRTVGAEPISEPGPADSMQWFTGRGLFYLTRRQQGDWLTVVSGHDQSDRDWFTPYMPVLNVSPDYPPTMLLHGAPDTDVPIEQSVLMQQQFIEQGVEHRFVSNDNWNHAFLYDPTDPTVDEAFGQIARFIISHI